MHHIFYRYGEVIKATEPAPGQGWTERLMATMMPTSDYFRFTVVYTEPTTGNNKKEFISIWPETIDYYEIESFVSSIYSFSGKILLAQERHLIYSGLFNR
jgi:hypothetical protein